jgi:hypothetical protein
MKRQRSVGVVAIAHQLERHEGARVLLIIRRRLGFRLQLRLQTLFELSNGRAVEGVAGQDAGLESPTIEAWTVGVETLADDLPATNNDGTVAVVERRLLGLSEAERQERIVSWRHFDLA